MVGRRQSFAGMARERILFAAVLAARPVWCAMCPGELPLRGHGEVALTNAGANTPGSDAGQVHLQAGRLVASMDARAYFSDSCVEGSYSHTRYSALQLLGKRLTYTTDVSDAGCGCNAAFYLVSMRQNSQVSSCGDYYCDANSVCGVACAEVDVQEASKRAWHSTLHSAHDHSGVGGGYGGGDNWNGPRDFNSQQYGPGARCIDTTRPFEVEVIFPVDDAGRLKAMEVTLNQTGTSCPLHISLGQYEDMSEVSEALAAGMTPVVSYWKSADMLWMDGKGADGQGPCKTDSQHCGQSVSFSNFQISPLNGPAPTTPPRPPPALPQQPLPLPEAHPQPQPQPQPQLRPQPAQPQLQPLLPQQPQPQPLPVPQPLPLQPSPAPVPAPPVPIPAPAPLPGRPPVVSVPTVAPVLPKFGAGGQCSAPGEDCRTSTCCQGQGQRCYEKNRWWASCKSVCVPGIDPDDTPENQQPWSCKRLDLVPEYEEVVLKVPMGDLPASLDKGSVAILAVGSQEVHGEVLRMRHLPRGGLTSSSQGHQSGAPEAAGQGGAGSRFPMLLLFGGLVLLGLGICAGSCRAAGELGSYGTHFLQGCKRFCPGFSGKKPQVGELHASRNDRDMEDPPWFRAVPAPGSVDPDPEPGSWWGACVACRTRRSDEQQLPTFKY